MRARRSRLLRRSRTGTPRVRARARTCILSRARHARRAAAWADARRCSFRILKPADKSKLTVASGNEPNQNSSPNGTSASGAKQSPNGTWASGAKQSPNSPKFDRPSNPSPPRKKQ